jgi:hypothetical protein
MPADPDSETQSAKRDSVHAPSDSGASLWQSVLTVTLTLLCLGGSSLVGLTIGTAVASYPESVTCRYGASMTTWRCSSS